MPILSFSIMNFTISPHHVVATFTTGMVTPRLNCPPRLRHLCTEGLFVKCYQSNWDYGRCGCLQDHGLLTELLKERVQSNQVPRHRFYVAPEQINGKGCLFLLQGSVQQSCLSFQFVFQCWNLPQLLNTQKIYHFISIWGVQNGFQMGNDSPYHWNLNLYFHLQIKMLKTKLRFKMGLLNNSPAQSTKPRNSICNSRGPTSLQMLGDTLDCCWVTASYHSTMRQNNCGGKSTLSCSKSIVSRLQSLICKSTPIDYLVWRRRISCYSFPSWIHVSICLDLWRKTLNVIKFVSSLIQW